jgi:signal transduction histidine kinase
LRAFARTIAHDLRSPLRNLQAYAAALLDNEGAALSDAGARSVRRIVAVGRHMERRVTDLLAYSQLARAELRLQHVELDRVVQLALDDMETQIGASRARIECASPLPAVLGHEAVLVQIFDNLIGNALECAAPDVAPHVRIDGHVDGDSVFVRIADNGIGIPEDEPERVVDVSGHLHDDERDPGTGIGLAMCRKVVEFHGGKIHIDRDYTLGTRVVFTLPAAESTPASAQRTTQP